MSGKVDERVRLRHSNGNVYQGTILGGRMHGKGLLTWADGQKFEGEFVDNMMTSVHHLPALPSLGHYGRQRKHAEALL